MIRTIRKIRKIRKSQRTTTVNEKIVEEMGEIIITLIMKGNKN